MLGPDYYLTLQTDVVEVVNRLLDVLQDGQNIGSGAWFGSDDEVGMHLGDRCSPDTVALEAGLLD